MACVIPEPCKFPSLDSCQKRFLWTHKEADLAPYPVVGLVLQVGDAEKFSLVQVWFRKPGIFFFSRVSKQGVCFTATEEVEGDQRHKQLELDCEVDGIAPPASV